ncbi:hypothetical protein [Actinomadura yumaensis]|uniref:Uncharacterized protein n=1 Tax=Actinomadura yumaensis TaxID=111807 RepID=A0ABW2CS30_9ACTN
MITRSRRRAPDTPHEPTGACDAIHCHIHHVDEKPAGAYRRCLECGHVYRTARALRRGYRRQYWKASAASVHGPGEPLWQRVRRVLTVRASHVHFCQHCIHDL